VPYAGHVASGARRREDTNLAAAWDVAEGMLGEALPRRWQHSQGVGQAAIAISPHVVEHGGLLSQAAVLHDVGYAPSIVETGFHALDGARYLASIGMDRRVVSLVAHHSCAIIEAEERGLVADLAAFPVERDDLVDALIFCDMTVSPDGEPVTVDKRLTEVLDRYGRNSLVGRFVHRAGPELRQATGRVQARLAMLRSTEPAGGAESISRCRGR
jgi:hypothetical protein